MSERKVPGMSEYETGFMHGSQAVKRYDRIRELAQALADVRAARETAVEALETIAGLWAANPSSTTLGIAEVALAKLRRTKGAVSGE